MSVSETGYRVLGEGRRNAILLLVRLRPVDRLADFFRERLEAGVVVVQHAGIFIDGDATVLLAGEAAPHVVRCRDQLAGLCAVIGQVDGSVADAEVGALGLFDFYAVRGPANARGHGRGFHEVSLLLGEQLSRDAGEPPAIELQDVAVGRNAKHQSGGRSHAENVFVFHDDLAKGLLAGFYGVPEGDLRSK